MVRSKAWCFDVWQDGVERDSVAVLKNWIGNCMKKILILYTSVGEGHKTMAENIGWHLEHEVMKCGLVILLLFKTACSPGKLFLSTNSINKHLRFIWGWLYRWGHFAILPFRVFIAGLIPTRQKLFIDEYQPDMVITTQTTASGSIAYLKKRQLYRGLFGIAFSDYHLHRYWLYPQADFYLANIEEQKQTILNLSQGKEIVPIFVCEWRCGQNRRLTSMR